MMWADDRAILKNPWNKTASREHVKFDSIRTMERLDKPMADAIQHVRQIADIVESKKRDLKNQNSEKTKMQEIKDSDISDEDIVDSDDEIILSSRQDKVNSRSS